MPKTDAGQFQRRAFADAAFADEIFANEISESMSAKRFVFRLISLVLPFDAQHATQAAIFRRHRSSEQPALPAVPGLSARFARSALPCTPQSRLSAIPGSAKPQSLRGLKRPTDKPGRPGIKNATGKPRLSERY